jgi:murein DD-endopeptidase MepM/ murein hydrolase activator NlpD
VPHRAEARSASRHRRSPRARHRAPLAFVDPARALFQQGFPGERPRTALLTATLGAALIAGVAGGGAAAAATNEATAAAVTAPGAADAQPYDPVTVAPADPAVDPPASTDPSATPTRRADLPTPTGPADLSAAPTPPADLSATPTRPADLSATPTRPADLSASPTRPADVRAFQKPQADLSAFPGRRGDLSAAPARQKPRPKPAAARTTAAAWVHPNPAGSVTSCFGPRWGREHAGVDLAAPHGTPIVAAGAGVVVRAGEAGGYGNAVLIAHGNGYLTLYGHLSAVTVAAGERVTAGQPIGAEGSTGHSTGPHLHFEVHQGHFRNPVEPTAWMREHGVDIPGC